MAVAADAADPDAIRSAVAETINKFGGLDILVNNAGIAFAGPIGKIAFDGYRALAVNVTGVFVATQEAVRHVKDEALTKAFVASLMQWSKVFEKYRNYSYL
ncbi:SDR family oxidoreductase [Halopseudomonas laoshanensis]|uniref:SDR family oxidoreductase n=1 Tax=Halopseudomonas laoshanensis TaxID=2268758 RepID=UPI0015B48625